jgi:hypothetical protein
VWDDKTSHDKMFIKTVRFCFSCIFVLPTLLHLDLCYVGQMETSSLMLVNIYEEFGILVVGGLHTSVKLNRSQQIIAFFLTACQIGSVIMLLHSNHKSFRLLPGHSGCNHSLWFQFVMNRDHAALANANLSCAF